MVVIGVNDSEFHPKMGRVEKGFQNVKDSVFSLQGALAGLGITAVISQSIQAMNQMERASTSLAIAARYTGEDLQATTAAAKALAEDGLMSVTEASQGLQNLLSRGYGLEQSIDLMNRLKDSASYNRQSHLEFGEAIVGATEGLRNENSMLVDNAGVTKNVSVMWKEHAAQLGKSVEVMTQAEKRQAEYNGIMRETEGQVGNAERMTNTFQGAQARLNQELFNTKATLGQALVPALGNVLETMRPVIGGIRDMILWVETLGARVGATYDKLALRAEMLLSGKGMFSKVIYYEYARRVKVIDEALDETIADVVKRSDGAVMPDLGKDTGARRQDTIIPNVSTAAEKARKQREIEQNRKEGMAVGKDMLDLFYKEQELRYKESVEMGGEAVELFYKDLEARYKESAEFLNPLGKLTEGQQAAVDESAMASKWAANNKESDNNAQNAGAAFQAARAEAGGDNGLQQELLWLKQEEEAWMQSWAMQTDSFEVFEQRKTEIEQFYSEKRRQLKQTETAMTLASVGNTFGSMATAADAFYKLSGNRNKQAFKTYQLMQAGVAVVSTASGIMQVWGDTSSGNWYEKLAKTIALAGTGAAQLATIKGASDGGGGGGGGYSQSPTSFGTGGGVVTQPSSTQQQQSLNITVQVDGNIIADDRWIEERLAPAMKDLALNRNVNFGFATN